MIYLGDKMKKFLFLLISALIIGLLFSRFLFKQYQTIPVSNNSKKIYFIQQGVYSNQQSMKENTNKLDYYTHEKLGDKYYVYVCFTQNIDNINIIKKYFKSLDYDIYAKELTIENEQFLNILEQYDYLLSSVENNETVRNVCKQIVTKYEELVLDD